MKKLIASLALCLLAGCVNEGRYAGKDAGYIVSSVDARHPVGLTSTYGILIRKADRSYTIFHYVNGNPKAWYNDFKETGGHGAVTASRVPPGDYEIYNYSVS